MFEAVLLSLPRRGQTEDRLAVLCRDDATRREAAAVADPIHLVEDRPVPVTGPQEVGVQRMEATRFGTDRAVRSRNRLREHLTAEDVLGVLRMATTKQIFFERLDVEHVDDFGEHGIHRARCYHRPPLKTSRGEGRWLSRSTESRRTVRIVCCGWRTSSAFHSNESSPTSRPMRTRR